LLGLWIWGGSLIQALAQGTAFTYQGRLTDGGQPANGDYDLRFAVYDAASDGSLVGGPATNAATAVSNGLFTVTLDFGAGVFDGNARWLDIRVRAHDAGAAGFIPLSPRQALTPAPYAIRAATAASVPAAGIGPGLANISIAGYATIASNLASSAALTPAQIAAAGDLVFTNRVQIFTNTANPQKLDLGALIRALPKVSNQSAGFGGGKIQLLPGTYFTSTNGFSVNTPFMLEIAGSAYGQTAIVFTNWDGRTPCLSLASSSRNCLSTYIHDLYLCATTDKTNSILSITNTARDYLARLVICPWAFATNADGEAGGDYGRATNTIGLNISSINGQQTILEDISLAGLWVGAAIGVDHLRVHGYLGIENCGGGTSAAAWGTSIYSVGGGVVLNHGMNDNVIEGLHSYGTLYPLIGNANGGSQTLVIGGDWGESYNVRSLSVFTNGSFFVFLFHHALRDESDADRILQFNGSSWSVIDQPPPNVVSISQKGPAGGSPSVNFAVGGRNLLALRRNAAGNLQVEASNLTVDDNLTVSDLTSPPVFDYYNITISNSIYSSVNGTYTYAYTNSDSGYCVLTNANGSTNGIVILDPAFGLILLEPTNMIGSPDTPLAYWPASESGTTLSSMNGPWVDLNDIDNNVIGMAAASRSLQIKDGTVSAVDFIGNGSGLTNLQAGNLVGPVATATTAATALSLAAGATLTPAQIAAGGGVLSSGSTLFTISSQSHIIPTNLVGTGWGQPGFNTTLRCTNGVWVATDACVYWDADNSLLVASNSLNLYCYLNVQSSDPTDTSWTEADTATVGAFHWAVTNYAYSHTTNASLSIYHASSADTATAASFSTNAENQGVVLIRANGTANFFGKTYTAVSDAVTAASNYDTVLIGHGTYQGNLTVSKPLNIIGAGPGALSYDDHKFHGGTILHGGFFFATGWSNSLIRGIGVQITDDSQNAFHVAVNTDAPIDSQFINCGAASTNIAYQNIEKIYFGGRGIVVDDFEADNIGGHGFVVKNAGNVFLNNLRLHNVGSIFNSLLIKADDGFQTANVIGRNISIINTWTNARNDKVLKIQSTGEGGGTVVSNVQLSDVTIQSLGGDYAPVTIALTGNPAASQLSSIRFLRTTARCPDAPALFYIVSFPASGANGMPVETNIFFADSELFTTISSAAPLNKDGGDVVTNSVRFANIRVNGKSYSGTDRSAVIRYAPVQTGDVNIDGSISATNFVGDGRGLTNIPAGNLVGPVATATTAATALSLAAGATLTPAQIAAGGGVLSSGSTLFTISSQSQIIPTNLVGTGWGQPGFNTTLRYTNGVWVATDACVYWDANGYMLASNSYDWYCYANVNSSDPTDPNWFDLDAAGPGAFHWAVTNYAVSSSTNVLSIASATAAYATNADFNSYRLITIGDSLTGVNGPGAVSYPSILSALYHYNVLVNLAWPGQVSDVLAGSYFDTAYPYFPINTGNRTTIIFWAGKNDMGGIQNLSQATNVAAAIEANTRRAMDKAAEAGADLVLITQPYTPFSGGGTYAAAFANSEPCRLMVNAWLKSQADQAVIVDFDSVAPPSVWTNANGTLNTNISLDGLHPTAAVNTNLAAAIASAIARSGIATNAMRAGSPAFSAYYPKTNASGSVVFNPVPGTTTFKIGDSNATFDVKVSYLGDRTCRVPVLGVTFVSPRDLVADGDWGFRFVDHTGTNLTLFVDTSARGILVGGDTNEAPPPGTFEVKLPARFDSTISGDGSGLTNVSAAYAATADTAANVLTLANGVWLEHAGKRTFLGTNGAAFMLAYYSAAPNDTIHLSGDLQLDLGGAMFTFSRPVNIKGSGAGDWDYNQKHFLGGPVFVNGGVQYVRGCSNFFWGGFAAEVTDRLGGVVANGITSTDYVGMVWSDISIGCMGTSGAYGIEPCYISGMALKVSRLRLYHPPVHGIIIKAVDGLEMTDCEVHDRPSSSSPFNAMVIKATWLSGLGDVKNVKIRRLLLDQVHGLSDIEIRCDDTSALNDLTIDDVDITATGAASSPVICEFYTPTNNNWNNVRITNLRARGSHYITAWKFYNPVAAEVKYCFTNTVFANWVVNLPAFNYQGVQNITWNTVGLTGKTWFNNIVMVDDAGHATNFWGMDTNIFHRGLAEP
jgi:hypothetical protein